MKQLITILLAFYSISLLSQTTNWNENKLKEYWKTNGASEIEGIYMLTNKVKMYFKGNLDDNINQTNINTYYIVKNNDWFEMGCLTCTRRFIGKVFVYNTDKIVLKTTSYDYFGNASAGELTAFLIQTGENSYQVDNMRVTLDKDTYLLINDVYTKIFSPQLVNPKPIQNQLISGTGFAIFSNGIIVTNNHVIDGAKTIKVRGVNSDFNKTYKAKVLISDKNNDLALIQIDDYSFTSLATIPYTIKTSLAGVGENIFVLGYPLRATMGDEIKLTNGIISSKTGFQGDITCYQISAPVQPGNSGGPLFDSQGNLIGIITAKHIGAENASYAVKSGYLTNLIELLPSPPRLQTVNSMTGKSLTNQVELVKKFVYIVESE